MPPFVIIQNLLSKIGNHLIVDDLLHPVDVIHVIAGDDYRTEYAIQLFQQGFSRFLFFTGGWCKFHGWYHGVHGQQLAIAQGVPQDAIVYDDAAVTSTFAETLRLKAWMEQSLIPIQSLMVVSDPFHMRRARWASQFILGKRINVVMAPIPFPQTPFEQQWWNDKASTNYVKEEYIKSIYYFFRYQLSMKWLSIYDVE